ncbi:uncharacterized protein LOC134190967 [Corticium candelabrum]|uniref:uncharacterized protein LOC134190967 n=1 Tax=Corticium candelabrum TaxID=121492 RepID=UPI002E26682A|nr:uncharacterized protein LOC134190967 [Corticium candelabrum]
MGDGQSCHLPTVSVLLKTIPLQTSNGWQLVGVDNGLRTWKRRIRIEETDYNVLASSCTLYGHFQEIFSKLCSAKDLPDWDYTRGQTSLVSEEKRLEEGIAKDTILCCPPGGTSDEGNNMQIDRFYTLDGDGQSWLLTVAAGVNGDGHIRMRRFWQLEGGVHSCHVLSLMVFQPLDGFISADAENASSQLTSFRHYLDTASLLQQPPAISAMASTSHVQPSGIAMASSLVEAPMSHKLSGFPAQAAASGDRQLSSLNQRGKGHSSNSVTNSRMTTMLTSYTDLCSQSADRLLGTAKSALALDGWVKMGHIEGVRVMKSSSSIAFNLYPDEGLTSCVICVINVSVPIRYAVKYLWDTKHQTQWNGLFDSAETIEEFGSNVKVLHVRYKPVWPLNGQDFCLLVGKNKFDNSFVISERSVSHSQCPVEPDFKRVKRLESGFVMIPITVEESDSQQCTIALISRTIETDYDEQLPLPSEPHCLARLCEQLEQTFAILPSNYQLLYEKPEGKDDDTLSSSSSGSEPSSLPNEIWCNESIGVGDLKYRCSVQESMEDYPVQPISNRMLCEPTDEQSCIDYQTIGNQVAGDIMSEIVTLQSKDKKVRKSRWRKSFSDKGVNVFRRVVHGQPIFCYIAESVLEFDIEVVWQAVRNPFTRLHYDVLIKSVTPVEQVSASVCIYHCVMEAKKCFIKQSRDLLVLSCEKRNMDRRFLAYRSVQHNSCPVDPMIPRATIYSSGWGLELCDINGRIGTKVYYLTQFDPGSHLPSVILNFVTKHQPLCVAYLRDYLTKQQQLQGHSI